MARTHYIAGNWKMNTTKAEAVALAKDLVEQLKGKTNKYMIGVPFVYLDAVAQVVPFQLTKPFSVLPSLYAGAPQDGTGAQALYAASMAIYNNPAIANNGPEVQKAIEAMGITADPKVQGVIAVLALAINVLVLAAICKKAAATKTNPYTKEIWGGTKDFEEAMARAE